MLREITLSDMTTLRSTLNFYSEERRKEVIGGFIKNYILSIDFIREFYSYLTAEIVSKSAEAGSKIFLQYPEFFNKSVWISNNSKDINSLFDKEFLEKFEISNNDLSEAFKNIERKYLTIENFNRLKEFTDDKNVLISFVGRMRKENLLQFSKEELAALAMYLPSSIFENETGVFSDDLLEKVILKQQPCDLFLFLKVLKHSESIGWQNEIIRKVISEDIKIQESTGTDDNLVCSLLMSLDVHIIEDFILAIRKIDTNIFSYGVLLFLLENFDLSEDFCIEIYEDFAKNSLKKALGTYCKARDYERALLRILL